MRKIYILLGLIFSTLFFDGAVQGQTRSTINQTFYKADGSTCSGTVLISWKTFYSSDGRLIQAGSITSTVPSSGLFSVSIEAPASYSVTYALIPSSCNPVNELWQVPYSAIPLTISQVRAINPPPSFTNIPLTYLARTGALTGQGICWQSGGYYAPGNCFGDATGSPFVVNAQVPWDNSLPNDAIIGGVSVAGGMTPYTVDHDRFLMTNTAPNGYRVNGITGDLHVPANAQAYEACAVCGIILSASGTTLSVAGSFFAAPNANPPLGLSSTNHTAVTRLTGPPFEANWATAEVNRGATIKSTLVTIISVTDEDHMTVDVDLGVNASVPWARTIFLWGINALVEDTLPGAPANYSNITLINEWDFNVFNANTKILAMSIGGNSSTQPTQALGYLVNTLGNAKWNCGVCMLDGVATIGIQLGVSETTNGFGSIPIQFFSRNSAGDVAAAEISTDSDGDMLFNVGPNPSIGSNPGYLFVDGASNFIGTFTGTTTSLPASLTMFNDGRLRPGITNLAGLVTGESVGSTVACSDCKTTFPATGGGTGANCVFIDGTNWDCGKPRRYFATAASATFGAIASLATSVVTVPVTACLPGYFAQAGWASLPSGGTGDFQITAMAGTNQVYVLVKNNTGGSLTPASGDLHVSCELLP